MTAAASSVVQRVASRCSALPRRHFNTFAAVAQDITESHDLFESRRGRVNDDMFKALTVHPLQLEEVTPIQKRVSALLPNLVRPWDSEGAIPSNIPSSLTVNQKPSASDGHVPRDILVREKTGTGKTFAYIILAIESRLNYIEHNAKLVVTKAELGNSLHFTERAKLAYRRNSAGPLILAPTRELAIQIANEAQKLTTHQEGFQVQLLVGGAGKALQVKDWMELSRDLVIATPGRLRDLLTNEPEFRQGFKNCPLLVLDEADTLLSMGFRDDIDAIVSFLPQSPIRQTFLFTATMSRAIRQLSSWILSSNHAFIDATSSEQNPTPCRDEERSRIAQGKTPVSCDDEISTHHGIEKFHILCPTASDQLPTVLKLLTLDQLRYGSASRVIVFCPTIQMAELFSVMLRSLAKEVLPDNTTEIVTMHPKMEQSRRVRTRALFRKAGMTQDMTPTVLVSSDTSTRGVDYPGATRMIQVGIPSNENLYIHRIGRMARGVDSFVSKKGKEDRKSVVPRADLLLLPWEAGYMNWKLNGLTIKPLPIPILDRELVSFSPQSHTLTPEFLKSASAEIQRRVNPADVRRTAASLLGYYLPLVPSLRLQPNAVLESVSTWASECFGVSLPTLKRLPTKFVEAYEQSTQPRKTKGVYVDRLNITSPSVLGKAKSKNRSVWEGLDKPKRRPKRWH